MSQIPLPKPIFEIGFTNAKDELFHHCYKDLAEHLNRQILLAFRFQKNKTCVFSFKKFENYGDQFIPTDVVNLGYRKIKHVFTNRFFVAYKCDIFENNHNIWRPNKRKQFPANHSRRHQKRLKSVHLCNRLVRFLLACDLGTIFIFQVVLFHFKSTANQLNLINLRSTFRKSWSSQSPTGESSGLSVLLRTLLLIQ